PTHEPGHLGRRFDDVPGLVVELHVDEDVPGEEHPRRGLLAALNELDDLLGRHQHLAEVLLLAERLDALLERGLRLVLVARVRMHHVPVLRHGTAQRRMAWMIEDSARSTMPR